MSKLLHEELTHEIIGAFYAVYNELGWGFAEFVYANAMAIELRHRNVPFAAESGLAVFYRGEVVGQFRADMIVDGKVLLEFKAVERIISAHESQLLNYLRTSAMPVGLLLNFGPRAERRRLIFTKDQQLLTDR